MTDRYQKIREALAMGPTPGPWNLKDGRTDTVENAQGYPVCAVHWHPDERYGHGTRAAYIAACDPDTIRELLVERDALAAEVERLSEALRGWWEAYRPVGWTEDQHRSCPHVNLATATDKALADAMLRAREASND